MLVKTVYEIEEYQTKRGVVPFRDWLFKLKDKRALAKIHARIDRASLGNFGDWKDIKGAKGIFEMREHYGPGYRIFYSVIGRKVVLLLIGSTKKDQQKAISKAKSYLDDYKRRQNNDT
jgi:putative addiction module killer protein